MPPRVGLKKLVKPHCAKVSLGEESTVLEVPTSRIALMTFERGNLVLRLRGAWAAPSPTTLPEQQGRGPSPAGISVQAPDIAASLNGASLPEEAIDQLSTLSDLRKSELWLSRPEVGEGLAAYNTTMRRITLSTKMRPLDKFVTADVSPIGDLVAELAQLEGKLVARMRKANEIYRGNVKAHAFGAPKFGVHESMYCVSTPLVLWGDESSKVDLTDLEKR